MNVAINGFGRIGRSVFRILENVTGIDVVAINDLFDYEALRYLLDYDTVMGPFGKALKLEDGHLVTAKSRVKLVSERNPADIPWKELGVDAVVDKEANMEVDTAMTKDIKNLRLVNLNGYNNLCKTIIIK